MNPGKAIGNKAMILLPVMWILLIFIFNVSFTDSSVIGLILLILGYFTGDLLLLPKIGNAVSTMGDFFFSFIIIWAFLKILGYNEAFVPSLITSLAVAAGEWFYHKWLVKHRISSEA
ncbi:DUF2512 family protein [Neobacillus sp. PS3-34]|uniref:DUF2512 family protein n=1 Tax=Neobacillus sp. PS3-34 TaxID=3070678 RepID=UPI0027DF1B57|nr:DUF2512 family protein [Neobacillus sp. PS3-34]WML48898.1 DUF2512 family protein [Neobacillus sp. PS3-34]